MFNKQIRIGAFRTSEIELRDLLKGWIGISAAFAVVMGGIFSVQYLIYSLFTVGIGFVLHELAHKIAAQHYGYFAEFRADDKMIMAAIFMSFFGFVFAAPGAVIIHGYITKDKNGIISLAGPLTNLCLAAVFLGLLMTAAEHTFLYYGFMINSWLALFNLLPFWQFDGVKVLNWNKAVYVVMTAAAIVFVFMLI